MKRIPNRFRRTDAVSRRAVTVIEWVVAIGIHKVPVRFLSDSTSFEMLVKMFSRSDHD